MQTEVVAVVGIPYAFTDKDGKAVSGTSMKACVLHFNDDNTVRSMEVVKCVPDFKAPLKTRGNIYFDGYGRCSKFEPLQG